LRSTLLARVCLPVAALAIAAFAAPGVASAASVSALPDSAGPVTPACAWNEAAAWTSNTAAPDSSAVYWVLPFTVQDGLQISLAGRFPDARFASFQVYKTGGGDFTTNGVSDALTDYQIQPDRGSVNPWQHRHQAGGKFTVTVQPDAAPGEANTLPLAPAGVTSGTEALIYRVYLPVHDDFAKVPLPVVTFTLNGVSAQVPACPAPAATASSPSTAASPAVTSAAATPSATTAAAAGSVEFARAAGGSAGYPNADSGYLTAAVTPPANGDVVVIQGKAPVASSGNQPSPWPGRGVDVRYWSLCNYVSVTGSPLVVNDLPDGQVDYGCRNDEQTSLSRNGYYTYVVGTESQRAAIDKIRGATFVPFSTAQPTTTHLLVLRNMLANPDFAEAIQNVPAGGGAASAAQVMGQYYPQAAVCSLATLARGGVSACLGGTQ
jgi:hypothetical protein